MKAANDILGKNLGSLKGKTVRNTRAYAKINIQPVPSEILEVHKNITLTIKIIFVNKIPFLVTTSRSLNFCFEPASSVFGHGKSKYDKLITSWSD